MLLLQPPDMHDDSLLMNLVVNGAVNDQGKNLIPDLDVYGNGTTDEEENRHSYHSCPECVRWFSVEKVGVTNVTQLK